jgi:hypothetical protein
MNRQCSSHQHSSRLLRDTVQWNWRKKSCYVTQQFCSPDVFKESTLRRTETLSFTPTQTGGITRDIYRTERDVIWMQIHTTVALPLVKVRVLPVQMWRLCFFFRADVRVPNVVLDLVFLTVLSWVLYSFSYANVYFPRARTHTISLTCVNMCRFLRHFEFRFLYRVMLILVHNNINIPSLVPPGRSRNSSSK